MAPINNAQSGSEILQQVVHILTQHGLIHPYSEQDTQALSVGVTLPKSEALTGNRGFHAALTILTLDTGDAHFPLEFSSWLVVLDATFKAAAVSLIWCTCLMALVSGIYEFLYGGEMWWTKCRAAGQESNPSLPVYECAETRSPEQCEMEEPLSPPDCAAANNTC